MANLYKLKAELLNDGRITCDEVNKIKAYIERDGRLDYEDIAFLVELLVDAREVCQEFDELFFPVLRSAVLADGKIGMDEQYQLLRMLYADGKVRESEKRFLRELYDSVDEITPEFEELCRTAFDSPASEWGACGHTQTAN